jgi:outer membrane protein assembly factor BamB
MTVKKRIGLPVVAAVAMLAITGMELKAQEWPQWRGANRDGVSKEAGLNLDWTASRPPLAWTFREAGAGYSAPTIVGTTLYSQGAANGSDFAFALDTRTGNLKWKQNLGAAFVEGRGNGPRGSVTVDGDRLYLIRGGGQIHCLSATDGRILWTKDFRTDLGGNLMSRQNWGFSESPLIDGNLVICTPGGEQGTLAALDKNTGNVVWRSTEWTDLSGYSSSIVAEIDGVRQYIQMSRSGVAGIAASNGRLLWKADVAGNANAVIPTPVAQGNIVYVTSGYNAGCAALRLTRTGETFSVETLYTERNMSNHHGGVVLVNGHIYGFSDASGWLSQNLMTGETVWSERNTEVGKGAVIAVNDRLILLDERTGLITVAAASPNGWREFGRMGIPERTKIESMDNMVWTHPVVADGKLFIRDHDLIFGFDLTR